MTKILTLLLTCMVIEIIKILMKPIMIIIVMVIVIDKMMIISC